MKSLTIEKEQLKGMPASIKQCRLFLVLYPGKQLYIESLKMLYTRPRVWPLWTKTIQKNSIFAWLFFSFRISLAKHMPL